MIRCRAKKRNPILYYGEPFSNTILFCGSMIIISDSTSCYVLDRKPPAFFWEWKKKKKKRIKRFWSLCLRSWTHTSESLSRNAEQTLLPIGLDNNTARFTGTRVTSACEECYTRWRCTVGRVAACGEQQLHGGAGGRAGSFLPLQGEFKEVELFDQT